MPLPNPFCGVCKPKGDAMFAFVRVGIFISFFFLVYTVTMLAILSSQGKLGDMIQIAIGFLILFGATLNFILQIVMNGFPLNEKPKKSLKKCRAWLILSIMDYGICSYTVYFFVSQLGGVQENGLLVILSAVPIVYNVYVWYIVLVFTYQLHLDAAAAAASTSPPSVVTVDGGNKEPNVPQRLPNSPGAPRYIVLNQNPKTDVSVKSTPQNPNSTSTAAPNLNSILSAGDYKKTTFVINHPD